MSGYAGYTGSGPQGIGGYTAENPATGDIRTHDTRTGAALDQGWQDLKSQVPGTGEYRAAHSPMQTTTGGGAASDLGPGYAQPSLQSQAVGGGEMHRVKRDERADYDENPPSGYPVATEPHKTSVEHPHIVQNPATGEVQEHSTKTGGALHQAWQDLKQATPGTKEHKAVYGEGSTTRRA